VGQRNRVKTASLTIDPLTRHDIDVNFTLQNQSINQSINYLLAEYVSYILVVKKYGQTKPRQNIYFFQETFNYKTSDLCIINDDVIVQYNAIVQIRRAFVGDCSALNISCEAKRSKSARKQRSCLAMGNRESHTEGRAVVWIVGLLVSAPGLKYRTLWQLARGVAALSNACNWSNLTLIVVGVVYRAKGSK